MEIGSDGFPTLNQRENTQVIFLHYIIFTVYLHKYKKLLICAAESLKMSSAISLHTRE